MSIVALFEAELVSVARTTKVLVPESPECAQCVPPLVVVSH